MVNAKACVVVVTISALLVLFSAACNEILSNDETRLPGGAGAGGAAASGSMGAADGGLGAFDDAGGFNGNAGFDANAGNDRGPSVLVNPSFEAGLSGWTIDPPTAMTKYVYTQFAQGGSMTIDGQNELATWSPTDAFTVRIFQTPMNLPSGTYTFSAYFNRGDGFNAAYMYARNCGGTDQQLTIPVTSATQWVKSQITVQVTAGQCEVGIYEESNPTDWLNADALSFAEDPQ